MPTKYCPSHAIIPHEHFHKWAYLKLTLMSQTTFETWMETWECMAFQHTKVVNIIPDHHACGLILYTPAVHLLSMNKIVDRCSFGAFWPSPSPSPLGPDPRVPIPRSPHRNGNPRQAVAAAAVDLVVASSARARRVFRVLVIREAPSSWELGSFKWSFSFAYRC